MFQACKTCLLLGTLFVTFAFNVWAQTYVGDNQQVVVSVYDDAGVSARTLVQAERKAGRIFEHAGLDVVWKNCASSTKHIGPESEGCAGFNWPTHLAVRVLPQSEYSTNEVFGMAFLSAGGTGCYSDVFYDRAAELQTAWNVDLADILGNVMAHELGHLLLNRTRMHRQESCEPAGAAAS